MIAGALVWAAGPAQAVHDTGQFELEGNLTHDTYRDWADLFDASGSTTASVDPINGPILAAGFKNDVATPDTSYFASSNKDIDSIASWSCGPANNPLDKDDLQHAYATLIHIPGDSPDTANRNHDVLYLGSDRLGNKGDAFAGFWLLKDSSVGCTSGSFSGHHTDGDLLIVSDYTNGGNAEHVKVYKWVGDDASGHAELDADYNPSQCSGSVSNDNACADANDVTVAAPWRSGILKNEFVETGIDMTHLLAGNPSCFSTFLAETRTSQELTAELKDFAGGQFNTCPPPPITTVASGNGDLNAPGSDQSDTATVHAVGNRPTPTGSVSFYLCQPGDVTNHTCAAGDGDLVSTNDLSGGTATSDTVDGNSTPDDNTPGEYCWRAQYTPDQPASNSYVASVETDFTDECFTIVHGSPTISTQIAVTGDNSPGLGFTTLGDTAQLSGFVGTVTGETITFKLYDVTADANCSGTPVLTTHGTLDASGAATTDDTYDPTAAHKYTWIASYGGNALNDPVTGSCSDANESETIVGATIDVSKSATVGTVSAGQTIGFDITVTNSGAVPAKDVTVTDVLPTGSGDLAWVLAPGNTVPNSLCSIAAGVLSCNLGTVDPGQSVGPIHIESSTTAADCGVVDNKATVSTSNGTGGDSDIAHVTVLCPSVTLTKTADNATVNAGEQIGFTITAHNSGPGTAFGVVINDPLPTGSGVSWSIAGGVPANCSIANDTLSCTAVDLASGATESVHIISATAFASCKAYPNEATLTSTNSPTLKANDTTTVQCPDLDITKTAGAAAVNAGTDISFTVTASNTGQGDATGALINDPLPHGSGVDWTIDSQTGPLSCSITGNPPTETLTCTGTLGAGQTETVVVSSHTTGASCGAYDNTATLTATNDPNSAEDSASTSVLCADLVIHKDADAAEVNVGSDIGFSVTITNTGDGAASNVDVEDPLPAGEGIDWSIDAAHTTGPLTCVLDGNPPTETLKCTGTLTATGVDSAEHVHVTSSTQWTTDPALNSCGVYNNTATVTWSFGPALPISSNEATEAVLCPNLTLTKTAHDDFVSAGDEIGFKIELTNTGAGAAVGAVIDDPLPAGTDVDWTIDSATVNGTATDECSITGAVGSQVLHCDLGMVVPGDDVVIHIVSATTQVDCAIYDNTATLTTVNVPGADASDSTEVRCPDITLEKTADSSAVNDGEPIGFTLTVTNANNPDTGTGHDVALHDALPGGPAGSDVVWTIDPAYPGPGTCEITGDQGSQALDCHFGNLPPNTTVSVHLMSNTSFVSCGDYPNTATESASNDADHTANATVSVICPVLDNIVVVADDAGVPANKPIGFTLSGQNEAEHLTTEVTTGTAKTVSAVHKLVAPLLANSVEPGTVVDAVLVSALPAGTGIHWSIAPAYSGPGSCAIAGPDGSQILTCQLGDLAPQEGFSVHIVSDTVCESGGAYLDKGTLSASNVPDVSSQDTTRVLACAIVIQRPPPPVASTGTPLLGLQLTWGIVLITLGGFVVLAARRRRRGVAETE